MRKVSRVTSDILWRPVSPRHWISSANKLGAEVRRRWVGFHPCPARRWSDGPPGGLERPAFGVGCHVTACPKYLKVPRHVPGFNPVRSKYANPHAVSHRSQLFTSDFRDRSGSIRFHGAWRTEFYKLVRSWRNNLIYIYIYIYVIALPLIEVESISKM